jgi:serine/threonine-protein kinase
VLPLQDLSVGQDQAYFSDGMAEELQSRLAQVPGLQVAGRGSSQSFKGKNATIAQIGKALAVANVLEGSVRKDGERLRITVQLSNAGTGFQIWTQTYDRKLTDVFAVQDDIAEAVVEALKLKLLGAAPATSTASRRYTPRFEVYDLYLRGRGALVREDEKSLLLARDCFRKAAAMDPNYPDAFAELAMAESFVGEQTRDPVEQQAAERRAFAAAEQAVKLDPTLGDAVAARGYLRTRAWDWEGALSDVRQSIALDPRDGRNQLRYAYLLSTLGHLDAAQAALEKGSRADPLFTPLWYWLGRIETARGDYASADRAMHRTLALDADFRPAKTYQGVLALLQGDNAKARDVFRETPRGFGLQIAEYRLAPGARTEGALRRRLVAEAALDPFGAAIGFTALGEKDAAFQLLDGVVARHESAALGLPYEPQLRELHGDARFAALLKRMGLPRG